EQITQSIQPNTNYNELLRVQVNTVGIKNRLTLQNMVFNTKGSTDINDIARAHIWYTAGDSNFKITTQYGSAINQIDTNNITITDSILLISGPNYFWISYDIHPNAKIKNVVDAQCISLNINATQYSPDTVSPYGNRFIGYCNPIGGNDNTYNSYYQFGITNVSLNTLSNSTGVPSAMNEYYSDYTSSTTQIIPSNSYTLAITPGSSASGFTQATIAWIDWNQNYRFDSAELIGKNMSHTGICSLTVSVPSNIKNGQYRLRIMSGYGYYYNYAGIEFTPCQSQSVYMFDIGECEDYTVQVIGALNKPTISPAGNSEICIGSTKKYTTAFDTSYNYIWYTNSGNILLAGKGHPYDSLTYTPTQAGTDTIRVKIYNIYNNIDSSDYILLTTNGLNTAGTVSTNKTDICSGDTVILSSTMITGTAQWQYLSSSSWINTGTSNNSLQTSPADTTTYRLYSTNNACPADSSNKITINVSKKPYAGNIVTQTSTICAGDSIKLAIAGANGTINWGFYNGNTWQSLGLNSDSIVQYPNTNTVYRTIVTSGVCNADTSNKMTISINTSAAGGAATASSLYICSGDYDTLTVNGNVGSMQWQQKTGAGAWTNISGAVASTCITNPTTTTQYRCVSTSGSCGTAYTNELTISSGNSNIWTGNTNTDWRNAGNWCGGSIPTATSAVVIPIRNNMPVLEGNGSCSTLTIISGASLTLNTGATLVVNGLMTNNGTFTHNGGVLNLNSPQVVPGGTYYYLKLTGTSGEYKFSDNATINNNFVIGIGTTVNDSGKTITVLRDITNDGIHKGNGKIKLTASSVYQTMSGSGVYGNMEVATGTTSGVRFVNNTTINNLLQLTSGTVIVYTNTTLTVGSNTTSTGNITFASGTQIVGSSSSSTSLLQILGNSSAPAITSFNFSSPGSLTINRPNGVILGALCKVGGTLTLTEGKLSMNGYNLSIGQSNSSNGFVTTFGTGKISNASNTAGYMYIYGTSSSAAQITGLFLDTMYNIYISYPLGVSLGSSFVVNSLLNMNKGGLDLNGYTITLSSAASVSEAKNNLIYGTTGYLTTTRNYTSALSSNNIAGLGLVVTSNQSMGSTTIVRGHALSQQNSQNSVRRYYTLQPSNYSGLVYNNIEFRYDSLECGTGLTTPSRHVIAKNTTAGATSGWSRIASDSKGITNNGTSGYQWVVSKNIAGAAAQVFTVFDSVSASLTPSVYIQPNEVAETTEMNAWPNPFNKDLNITFVVYEDITTTINLLDISGKIVGSQVVKAQKGTNTISFNPIE
ncbi:MAG: hypothetical protein HYZ42_14325, partial [Bacteroidetes bacterium]|nr:hypothetical protein [Bacteroidota bacterium]